MAVGRILGLDVSEDTLARWARWFAPDPQPFLVEGEERVPVPDELRDTFELFGLTARHVAIRWISEAEYFDMARNERAGLLRDQVRLGRALVPTVASLSHMCRSAREEADGRRFVWWPSLLTRRNRRHVPKQREYSAPTPVPVNPGADISRAPANETIHWGGRPPARAPSPMTALRDRHPPEPLGLRTLNRR
jgi:hypothetical protein